MKRSCILIVSLLIQAIVFVACEKQFIDPDPNTDRAAFLVIGDTTNCIFNSILETYEKNDSFDLDLDQLNDLMYEITDVWEECDDTPDPDCNPDSGCVDDCWPTIYTDYILHNLGEFHICVDEYGFPLMLAAGDTISNKDNWLKTEINLLCREAISNSWNAGNWTNDQPGYLGLREISLPDTIYSWARMSMNSEGLTVMELSKTHPG